MHLLWQCSEAGWLTDSSFTSAASATAEKASSLYFGAFQETLNRLSEFTERVYAPHLSRPPTTWRGLPRYRAALGSLYEDQEGSNAEDHQYAKASTIYDGGDSINFTYYADVAGFVPETTEKRHALHSGLEKPEIGNGDLAPEWGIDLRLEGGTLTYGPWADRQRCVLFRA